MKYSYVDLYNYLIFIQYKGTWMNLITHGEYHLPRNVTNKSPILVILSAILYEFLFFSIFFKVVIKAEKRLWRFNKKRTLSLVISLEKWTIIEWQQLLILWTRHTSYMYYHSNEQHRMPYGWCRNAFRQMSLSFVCSKTNVVKTRLLNPIFFI